MADFPAKTVADWQELAGKDLRGRDPEALTWQTPEGIAVKPLYTAEDLEGLGGFVESLMRAGAPIFPDEELENHLRRAGGLPEISAER